MRRRSLLGVLLLLLATLAGCGFWGSMRHPPIAIYDAWLESPGGRLAFGLELGPRGDPRATLINGDERIDVPVVEDLGTTLRLSMPHYDSTVELRHEDGQLVGEWTKVRGVDRVTRMVFGAEPIGFRWRAAGAR